MPRLDIQLVRPLSGQDRAAIGPREHVAELRSHQFRERAAHLHKMLSARTQRIDVLRRILNTQIKGHAKRREGEIQRILAQVCRRSVCVLFGTT